MSKGMSPLPPPPACIPPLQVRALGDQYPRQWSVQYLWIIASFFPPYYRWVIFSKLHHFKINREQSYSCLSPLSYSTTLFFFPLLHLYDTKQLVVKEMLEAGVEEVLLNWVWSTLSLQNEGNVSLNERTIHKYITCSVSFFRLEQFFSLLWETQNHSCVFSAWCAD